MKRIVVIIGLLVAMPTFAQESNDVLYKRACSLFKTDKEKAFPLFCQLAEVGDKRGERNVGQYYYNGYSPVEKNYALAYEWYKKAADQGDGVSLNNIGWMYQEGQFLTQSKEKAFEYYKKASDAGNAYGSANVAWMYWNIEGEEDFPPIDKSKNYGEIPNYYCGASVGVMSKSTGTDNAGGNSSDGNKWRESVHEDEEYVQLVIDNNGNLNLDVIPVRPEEEYFLKAAIQDSAFGMYELANYYDWNGCNYDFMHFRLNGEFSNQDELHQLFTIAADHGNANAQATVGSDLIIKGKYAEALTWLNKAKRNGATKIHRPNVDISIDGAIAVCKHLSTTTAYKLESTGDCVGAGIAAYDDENNSVSMSVENKEGKTCTIKLNHKGQIISKTPFE